ncbi:MAG: hypothetical protein DME21_11640 [Verrucomicrobia bacterium]|nr:MAG: hypothetical protein DME21_11640 [Verrucomicrobiota bacterium]
MPVAGQISKPQTPGAKEIPSIKFQTTLRRLPVGDLDLELIWDFGFWDLEFSFFVIRHSRVTFRVFTIQPFNE